jgi:hypothetical protein
VVLDIEINKFLFLFLYTFVYVVVFDYYEFHVKVWFD